MAMTPVHFSCKTLHTRCDAHQEPGSQHSSRAQCVRACVCVRVRANVRVRVSVRVRFVTRYLIVVQTADLVVVIGGQRRVAQRGLVLRDRGQNVGPNARAKRFERLRLLPLCERCGHRHGAFRPEWKVGRDRKSGCVTSRKNQKERCPSTLGISEEAPGTRRGRVGGCEDVFEMLSADCR